MCKKKVLLGIVGQYRTFKETKKFLFEDLIEPNSSAYDFDIVLNTDKTEKQPDDKPRVQYEFIEPDLLEKELRSAYGSNLKHIMFYEIDGESGSFIFRKRCKQIFEWAHNNKENYDLYFFIRFDAILTSKILLNEFPENQLTNLTGPDYKHEKLYGSSRIDHYVDWDFCFFGSKRSVDWYLNNGKYCNLSAEGNPLPYKNKVSYDDLIEFSKNHTFKTGYIDYIKTIGKIDDTWIWVYELWCLFHKMEQEGTPVKFIEGTDLLRHGCGLKMNHKIIHISLGNCGSIKWQIRKFVSLRKEHMFFDWMTLNVNSVIEVLSCSNIDEILNHESIIIDKNLCQDGHRGPMVFFLPWIVKISSLSFCSTNTDIADVDHFILNYKNLYYKTINTIKSNKPIAFIRRISNPEDFTEEQRSKFIKSVLQINKNCKFILVIINTGNEINLKEEHVLYINLSNKNKDEKDWRESWLDWPYIFKTIEEKFI